MKTVLIVIGCLFLAFLLLFGVTGRKKPCSNTGTRIIRRSLKRRLLMHDQS